MWLPSFAVDYAKSPDRVTADILPDPGQRLKDCGNGLAGMRCRWYTRQFGFTWWKVDILVNALSAMNAPVDVMCVHCPADAPHRAGYSPRLNKVWVCANLFWNPFELRRVLAHELVHAFDFARAKLDVNDKQHVACTEIRAWNLSGECELWRKFGDYAADDPLGLRMWSRKQRCVKEGALRSMGGSQDDMIAINDVFERCFRDHWPFTTEPHMDTRFRDSPMLTSEA